MEFKFATGYLDGIGRKCFSSTWLKVEENSNVVYFPLDFIQKFTENSKNLKIQSHAEIDGSFSKFNVKEITLHDQYEDALKYIQKSQAASKSHVPEQAYFKNTEQIKKNVPVIFSTGTSKIIEKQKSLEAKIETMQEQMIKLISIVEAQNTKIDKIVKRNEKKIKFDDESESSELDEPETVDEAKIAKQYREINETNRVLENLMKHEHKKEVITSDDRQIALKWLESMKTTLENSTKIQNAQGSKLISAMIRLIMGQLFPAKVYSHITWIRANKRKMRKQDYVIKLVDKVGILWGIEVVLMKFKACECHKEKHTCYKEFVVDKEKFHKTIEHAIKYYRYKQK